ncbi:hypothetical protein N658DRAFT_416189 [Parathielavia hyrcaniae]|uniref:RhoGAP-domain-containing protein n=1 Tax=Parathielavia hyrcaniae TaxID=113614 RepID=A0AAN6QCV5_9PEZI|nr:hypothetical protein N658DRAFT_416189 [Parathielavia hyrcaniae]
MDSHVQDSPTIGRTQVLYAANSPLPTPTSAPNSRSRRVPASPLSMDSSSAAVPRIVTTAAPEDCPSQAPEKTYYNSDSSGSATPEERSPGCVLSPPIRGTWTARAEHAKNPPRTSSIDSAISVISTRSSLNKASADGTIGATELANLIKKAGSAEAVIQYLLKEKQSQSQQNAQLWRLVDKQRAMILGLNKDLERALKDKEKYRKKLKEILDSTVGEMLDPSHTMPKPSEHALHQFDPDEQERAKEAAARQAEESKGILINMSIPPSRTAPREPPRMPPPQPPVGLPDRSPKSDDSASKFPPPPAPPPRKPPPAPLHLKHAKPRPSFATEDEPETDTEYDHILEVDEANLDDRRGRRRTREEDEREREMLVRKEAEIRSLSKKSKKSGSRKAAEKPEAPPSETPASPRLVQTTMVMAPREPASLAGVLNGAPNSRVVPPPLLSPGLPSSPRPMNLRSPVNSPPLSPLGVSTFPGMPLSPRPPPRAPIPFPPNTPLHTPSPAVEPLALKSPRPLNLVKHGDGTPSPTKSSTDSPVERTRIFKGFVTDEHPDLLLPPNALPSIDIKVASSRMKPSRASLISLTQLEEDPVFTLAVYSRGDGGELWRIEKDSASLAKLDQRLKQCPTFTAKTPDRSLFSGHAPAKLDARRIALNQYLDELLNTPLDNVTALELCRYLSTNTLPPNADETGSSTGDSNLEPQRFGPGGRPFRSGYLTKKGKNFGGWKARYFVLDGPLLKYYETPGGAHLGTIKLQRAQIGKQAQHPSDGTLAQGGAAEEGDNQYRHAFLILEPKKKDPNSVTKHVLCAESDRERDQWVEALLRWIDYRDPDEEEAAKKDNVQDRHGERGHAKRKAHGQAKQQQQQAPSADESLIGVSYEATKQGDAPQGLPGKGKQAGHQDHESTHSQSTISSYTISAPRDPQVISHSESWGSKLGMGLTPPTQEEKKARKRSFFGFGPKTRTSSDGQDSLFGSESGSSLQTNQYQGPINQAFGATLAEAVRYNAPTDVKVPLPAVVYRCIQYLEAKNAILEEGIFRLSGSNLVIKQLRERFNVEGDINLLTDGQYHDIHAIASLLKMYLRELPTTILTNDLRTQFISVMEMPDHKEKMAALAELVERLPQANAALLKYLIAFLIRIIDHSDVNKMTVRNVGIVFSPTLNIPAPVFATFLQNYEAIFGIEPGEYELPVTEPEFPQERRPSLPTSFQERRPSDGRPSDGRPSTSHSDSPHRQRLMEALEAQGTRSTPTPPPMTMQQMAQMNAATLHSRSTPTPPPLQRQMMNYESPGQSHMRPAYEGGYDSNHAHHVAGHNGKPSPCGYDRPLYENGLTPAPAYDQPYRNRRESVMFMGTLSQQPSKSRLREEAHTPNPMLRNAAASASHDTSAKPPQPSISPWQAQPQQLSSSPSRAPAHPPDRTIGAPATTSQAHHDHAPSLGAAPAFSPQSTNFASTAALDASARQQREQLPALYAPPATLTPPDDSRGPSSNHHSNNHNNNHHNNHHNNNNDDDIAADTDADADEASPDGTPAAQAAGGSTSTLAAAADPKKPRACESCRALKVRCDFPPDDQQSDDPAAQAAMPSSFLPCRRCAKTKRKCVVTQPTRKRQRKTDTRVAELEKKIDALTASLVASRGAAAGVGAGIGIGIGSPGTPAPAGMGGGGGNGGWERRGEREGEGEDEGEGEGDGNGGARGLVPMAQAEKLLARYTNEMCPHLPAVVIPPGTTAAELRTSKPILFLAVITAASGELAGLQQTLTKELMQVLADRIIVRGNKSLELVQAVQVAVIWYWPPDRFEDLKFYQLVHIAAVMAIELGLGRNSPAWGGFKKHIGQAWRDNPHRKQAPPNPTSVEARRAWLTCYFMATNTAMALHRPNLLRWTPFVTESMDVLKTSPDAAPTDKYLCHLVWTHRLAEDIGIQFSMDDPASTPNLADPRTQHVLRGFERELERHRESIPKELQKPTLQMSLNVISLYMHEVTIQSDPSDDCRMGANETGFGYDIPLSAPHINALSACLEAINGIIRVFLSLDVPTIRCLPGFNLVRVAYAIVVLIKIHFAASAPKSDLGSVINKDEMKVGYYLDSLLEKFRAAAKGGKSRPAARFLVVIIMIRTWFSKQRMCQNGGDASQGTIPQTSGTAPSHPRQPGERRGNSTSVQPQKQPQQHQPQQSGYPATANTPLHLLSEVATNKSATPGSRSGTRLSTSLQNTAADSWLNRPPQLMYSPITSAATPSSNAAASSNNNNASSSPFMLSSVPPTPQQQFQGADNDLVASNLHSPWWDNALQAVTEMDYTSGVFGDGFVQAMDLTFGGLFEGGYVGGVDVGAIMQEQGGWFPPPPPPGPPVGVGVGMDAAGLVGEGAPAEDGSAADGFGF